MRLASPKPCCGPMLSSVRRTIRSSVPCKTSGLEVLVDIQEEYDAFHLECQEEGLSTVQLGSASSERSFCWRTSRNPKASRPTVAGRRRWRTRRCWRWRPVQPWSTGLCPSRSTNIRPNAGCPFLPDVIFGFRAMFVDSAFAILAGAVLSSGTGRRKFPWQRQRRTRPDIGGSLRTEYAADGTSPLQTHFWYRRVHTMGSWGRGSRGFTWTRERSRFRRAYPARRSPSHQRLSTKQAGPRRDRLEPTIWARRKTSLVCCQSAS